MFTYKPQFIAASKRSAQVARSIFVRLSSSSSSSATKLENVVEKDKAAAKPSTNNSGEQQQPFQLAADKAKSTKIPFMPVINIPETEFAHHSFFSLHRPLLGLSDDDEKPFFNSKSTEEQDQEKLDDVLASYMMNLQPFVEPAAPGAELIDQQTSQTQSVQVKVEDEQQLERGVSFKIIESEEYLDDFISSLPMYHMPASGDVLDYLTSVESNMKMEHANIFHQQHRDQNKLLIHIPALSPKSHYYPSLFLSTAETETSTKKPLKVSRALLKATSKTPLDAGLDNVLFVSTLDSYWTRTTSYRMKRHTSNGSGTQDSDNTIHASTLTTRRYSHPDTDKAPPMPTKPMMERLSFQSDAASTELIRRFSSESTTSSLSSISSFILESHSKLHQQQQKVREASSDAQTKDEEEDRLPIWADPIKVKENPTRFQYTKSYLQQRDMLRDHSLPLIKPCVFHFSDTSTDSRVTRQNKRAEQYMSTVKPIFECGSVWEFAARWRAFKEKCNKKPSQLTVNQNIFCFIHGVEPLWEDPVNKDGGRFFVTVYDNQHLDELFEWILCAFVGGNFVSDGVVGVAVSKRFRGNRIEFWFDKSADESKMPDFKYVFSLCGCMYLCLTDITPERNKLYDLLASTCHDVIKAGRYKKHFD
ncbi:hypothetical protein FB192DRAFT_1276178 [Mucor lusitanicus]|uniref:Translation initiation factor 4E n=1 Tax=Mucor circinelloides f. lusitanicus TaxID=29924 RepID=A0A8H4BQM9_MUCCL|nr:hypothetical protein FB192DRAFT_1276178 [Mucor lusitanicus]